MDAEAVYLRLPIFLQNAVCSLHGARINRSRFGPGFWSRLTAAEERLKWPAERLIAHRDEQLAAYIRHAATTVPFYRQVFENAGVRAESIRGLADLAVLPILTKADVQANYDTLVSDAVSPKRRIIIHTSGTTGGGLRFATTIEALQEQWAIWWRYRRLHGLQFDTWCGYFGGRSVVPLSQKRAPFWRYNRPGRQILFSGYHLAPATLPRYIDELRRRKPPWLHGYPSILAMLAGFLTERGDKLGYAVQWITTGAESLLPHQSELIERVFGVRPIEHYGMAEAVANSFQCPAGRQHVDEDFAAVEFIPTQDGSAQRVVGTNFTNPAVPLIRYEVGDHVQLAEDGCTCGLPGRVLLSVDGRQEDYVILRNNARLGRMDHIFKDMMRIREAQLYQDEPGVIRVRVVCNAGYGEADERMLLHEFRKRVGDQAQVIVEHVESIPRTSTGKLRFVVSTIRTAQLAAK
jgi:phenylacetate-CoA ligase